MHLKKRSSMVAFLATIISSITPRASGFASTTGNPSFPHNSLKSTFNRGRLILNRTSRTAIEAKKKPQNDDDENDEFVTKEMFLRNMIDDNEDDDEKNDNIDEKIPEEPKEGKVKRKKRNGSHYRVLDNRDNLPFLVKVTTPDPYTNNEAMAKKAKKNSEELPKGSKAKKNKKNLSSKRHNLIGMDGVDSIKSSIFKRKKDGSLDQVLGEFALDKGTNCGDILDVGDGREYQVQKARCQYKYVGGKKFVMTRKILEVKEMKRILVEKEVQQLFDNDGDSNDDDILQLE